MRYIRQYNKQAVPLKWKYSDPTRRIQCNSIWFNGLVKASRDDQTIVRVTPDSAGWKKYVGFAAYRLDAGDVVHVYDADRESCIVVLTGTVSVEVGDEHWQSIGSRDSVFEDAAPYAVYVPPKLAAIVRADRDAEIGVASAPASGKYPPRLIEPSQMKRSTRGKHANTRYVM